MNRYDHAADTLEDLAARFHETRTATHLSLERAGQLIGISAAAIRRFEHGSDTPTSTLIPILRWMGRNRHRMPRPRPDHPEQPTEHVPLTGPVPT